MANKIVQLQDESGDNIFPVAGGLASGSVATSTINNGAVTADKINFSTFIATGYSDSTIALNNTAKDICSITIPSNGDYVIDGEVRVSATGSSSVTRNCWSQFVTSGTGTFVHSQEEGAAMNAKGGEVGGIATIPVKNVIKNAKAGDTVSLQARTNASTSDISAYLGIMSAMRVG